MGEVWKARDTRLDRPIAALNHSNICTLHDVGPDCLVMEYIDGSPLTGPRYVDKAIPIAAQILDAAHKKASSTAIANPATSSSPKKV